MATMTLEQQLFALLVEHDLSSLSITVFSGTATRDAWIGASAQADGMAYFDAGGGRQDAAAAIGSAIGNLNVKRHPPVAEVETLAPMADAA